MSQSGVYSTFRTPQAKKQRPPIENGDYGPYWRTFSEGRGRRSEGIYATPSLGSGPAVSSAFSPSATVKKAPAVYNNTIKNGTVGGAINKFENKGGSGIGNGENLPPGHNSKLGNGFQTLPSSLYRGVRLYDPLNNVNRFQKRRSGAGTDSPDTGSLNNFEFYRKQQQQQQEPPSKNSTSSRSGSSSSSSGYGNMSYLHSKPGGQEHQTGTRNKPPHENKPSLLLSPDENRFIFEILGRGRQTLATAVGRLLTPTPDQQQWQVKDSTGAVCLVRDTTKKSYFIQVFSLRAKNMIFRQEIYNQFEYQMPQATFMTFEGDSSVVAILFADSTEASNFRDALDGKLEAKRQRRNERETRRSKVLESQVNNVPSHHTPQSNNHYASNNNNNVNNTPPSYPNGHAVTTTTTYTFPTAASTASAFKFNKKSKGKDKDKKKTKLTAKDIGTPMDFRHVQHVGWDPTKGFDLNLEDKDLRTFFEKAGVSANQLNDEKTRKFIYNFIEQNGGLDVVKRSANLNTPLRAPPPVPPSSGGSSAPPPVPTRTPSIPNSNYPGSNKPPPPPPPPSRPVPPAPPAATHPGVSGAVPPPPPARTTSHANQNSPTQYHNNHHQHPISNGPSRPPLPKHIPSNGPAVTASPPPPPPPPMPVPGAAPPPPPPPPPMSSPPSNNGLPESNGSRGGGGGSSLPPVSDDRSQLMQQIQKGIQLRKVEPDSQPKRVGGISDCLSEIQKGVDLKPVPESAKAQPSLDAMDGLAGALARALADRNRALNPDSSSSDDDDQDEYDDEDWE